MRLSENEKEIIKKTILAFDEESKVYLFGSRVDDTKKGGDIDLLIFSSKISYEDIRKIKGLLWEKIGEQKIDIVLADEADPFVKIALREGILL
jgi:uncharacterized protein